MPCRDAKLAFLEVVEHGLTILLHIAANDYNLKKTYKNVIEITSQICVKLEKKIKPNCFNIRSIWDYCHYSLITIQYCE